MDESEGEGVGVAMGMGEGKGAGVGVGVDAAQCWVWVNPHHPRRSRLSGLLQAQLQKAARADEKISKGDKNPKDFIVFPKTRFSVLFSGKDNTGKRRYIGDMVFPTLQFPSDHGLVSTMLKVN